MAVFAVVSILIISPDDKKVKSTFRSSQLKQIIKEENGMVRTDYVNDKGLLTIAANLGYSTKIITKKNEGELEEYFDDTGAKTSRHAGYYGVFRQYDENDNICSITYLDNEENPSMIFYGYAIEKREYNNKRQNIAVRYYDTEGNPVQTPYYGYGKLNDYDENGKIVKTVYIDDNGSPMMTKQGYSIVKYTYYSSDNYNHDHVEYEFYYDDKNEPVALSLGQYAVHKAYDEYGQESEIIYLDSKGLPFVTKKGYTVVKRTYSVTGNMESEQYYDIDGKPYRLPEGQYGTKRDGVQVTYLDQNGNQQFNIRNFLHNQSWVVIVIALIIVIISSLTTKSWNILLLFLYLPVIGYLTLFFRESGETLIEFNLLWSYKLFLQDGNIRSEILKNIWLFIPLGSILYKLYPKKVIILFAIILSVLIETIQFLTKIGLCELDDIISNSFGSCIGFLSGKETSELFCRKTKE